MATMLSQGMVKGLINPNPLSSTAGDTPCEDTCFSLGDVRIVLNAFNFLGIEHIVAPVALWAWDGFYLLSDWIPLEAVAVYLCALGVLLRAWAMETLGRLFSFKVVIGQHQKWENTYKIALAS